MKNLLFILLVLFSIESFSQIKTNGYVEIGWLNERFALNNSGNVDYLLYKNAGYSEIELKFNLKNIYLEQNLYNIFTFPDNGFTFNPKEINYVTRLYYKLKVLDLGVEHACLHPIINQHNDIETITRRQSHDKIFLRFNFGNN